MPYIPPPPPIPPDLSPEDRRRVYELHRAELLAAHGRLLRMHPAWWCAFVYGVLIAYAIAWHCL